LSEEATNKHQEDMKQIKFAKSIRPLDYAYRREWMCPRCGEIEDQTWAHGKIRILPQGSSSYGTLFEIVTPSPYFVTRWFCARVADGVPEEKLGPEVQEWVRKRTGVILIGPCAKGVDYEYCLYPDSEIDLPVPSGYGRYLWAADSLVLDQHLGKRPEQGEVHQQPQQDGPGGSNIEGPA
jgi:hypothetical protein